MKPHIEAMLNGKHYCLASELLADQENVVSASAENPKDQHVDLVINLDDAAAERLYALTLPVLETEESRLSIALVLNGRLLRVALVKTWLEHDIDIPWLTPSEAMEITAPLNAYAHQHHGSRTSTR
jgi:hypothetical protein